MGNSPRPCREDGAMRYILLLTLKSMSNGGSSLGIIVSPNAIPGWHLDVSYALIIVRA